MSDYTDDYEERRPRRPMRPSGTTSKTLRSRSPSPDYSDSDSEGEYSPRPSRTPKHGHKSTSDTKHTAPPEQMFENRRHIHDGWTNDGRAVYRCACSDCNKWHSQAVRAARDASWQASQGADADVIKRGAAYFGAGLSLGPFGGVGIGAGLAPHPSHYWTPPVVVDPYYSPTVVVGGGWPRRYGGWGGGRRWGRRR